MGAPRRATQEQVDKAVIALNFLKNTAKMSTKEIADRLYVSPSSLAPGSMSRISVKLAMDLIALGLAVENNALIEGTEETGPGILSRLSHLHAMTEDLIKEIRSAQTHAHRLVAPGLKQAEADAVRLLDYFKV